mmetsp:Transcript_7639/g.17493  ORF Transcript_7639/g.17493 Transcript_7639/m.17493 type:complete len:117 (+) Transcript_7639:217-567(+)
MLPSNIKARVKAVSVILDQMALIIVLKAAPGAPTRNAATPLLHVPASTCCASPFTIIGGATVRLRAGGRDSGPRERPPRVTMPWWCVRGRHCEGENPGRMGPMSKERLDSVHLPPQ